jgi:hypothetical protein
MWFGMDDQREAPIQESEEPRRQLEFAVSPAIAGLREMAAALATLRRIVIEAGGYAGVVQDDLLDRHTERPMVVTAEAE